MSDDNAQLLRSAYEAFGRGDIPAVLDTFADDIEWNVPDVIPHGTHVTGKDGVAGFFQGLAEKWDDFGIELEDIRAAGDRGYAVGRASGSYRGQQTGYGFVHVWTIRDGRCGRFEEYVDPAPELVSAAGEAAAA